MFSFLVFVFVVVVFPLILLSLSVSFLLGIIDLQEFVQKLGLSKKFYGTLLVENADNKENDGVIWVQVSSVGEWRTAELFLEKLAQRTQKKILLTYFNHDLEKYFKDKNAPVFIIDHFFSPIENPLAVSHILRKYNVLALVLVEMEIWPITIFTAKILKTPLFLVNAALFKKEFCIYNFFRFLFKPVFNSFDQIYVASSIVQKRFLQLSLPEKKVLLMGNFKIDRALSKISKEPVLLEWMEYLRILAKKRKIIIFSSFHFSERKALKVYFAAKKSEYFVVLAPRYVDDAAGQNWKTFLADVGVEEKNILLRSKLAEQFSEKKISFEKSKDFFPQKEVDILLLDTYGELSLLFSIADLVVIGGSFFRHGGQDILDPLINGIAVITGPYMFHFTEMMEIFKDFICQTDMGHLPREMERLLQKFDNSNDVSPLFSPKKRREAVQKIMHSLANGSENTANSLAQRLRFLKKIS